MPLGVYPRTAAHRKKISLAMKGRKITAAHKLKISLAMRGKKRTTEQKLKMSLSMRGRIPWNKGLTKDTNASVLNYAAKLSKILQGSKRSIASIQKQRESILKLYENPEIRAKYSKARIGSRNPNWKGGIDKDPYPFQFSYELKAKIRERDNHTCQLCGIGEEEHRSVTHRNLAINHIDYNKRNNEPSNLITLCMSCNSKVNFNRTYWTNYFRNLLKQLKLTNSYKS